MYTGHSRTPGPPAASVTWMQSLLVFTAAHYRDDSGTSAPTWGARRGAATPRSSAETCLPVLNQHTICVDGISLLHPHQSCHGCCLLYILSNRTSVHAVFRWWSYHLGCGKRQAVFTYFTIFTERLPLRSCSLTDGPRCSAGTSHSSLRSVITTKAALCVGMASA